MGRERSPGFERAQETQEKESDSTVKFREEVEGDRRKIAAAAQGDRVEGDKSKELKPGVVKNGDGSEVTYEKTADGKVHPVKLKYPNGDSTEYQYDAQGKVSQFTNRRNDGTVRERWISSDGGKTFTEERTGEKKEMNMKVRDDGTATGSDQNGVKFESRTDGSLLLQFKDADGKQHKVLRKPDESFVEYGKFPDGKERPIVVTLPNGLEYHYGYRKDGSVADISEWTPGGPNGGRLLKRYESHQEKGPDGKPVLVFEETNGREPPAAGKLEIMNDGTHVFTDAATGGQWIRTTDGSITVKDKQGNVVSKTPPIKPPRR